MIRIENMLSFFRTKSSEVDNIINGTKNLSVEPIEATTTYNMNINTPAAASSHVTTNQNITIDTTKSNELLKSLGYQNATELKESIYGQCYMFVATLFVLMKDFTNILFSNIL